MFHQGPPQGPPPKHHGGGGAPPMAHAGGHPGNVARGVPPQLPPQPPLGAGVPAGQPPQVGVEPENIRNLMVNYIPTTIDEMQLRQLFEMYGPVESVKIVLDRETRSSRGYGFVKYRFAFSAVHAIQYLNGYPIVNKRLKVAYANHEQKVQQAPAAAASGPQGGFQPPQGGFQPPADGAHH